MTARDRMIEANLWLVVAVARGHRGRGVPFADLVQEGTIGLIEAADRFDHRPGVKFSTYAQWWVRRAVLQAVASAPIIRIPAKANRQLAAVRNAEAALTRHGQGAASSAAIAERTGLSATTVQSLRMAARVTASLDEPVGEDGSLLGDLVSDERDVDPLRRAIDVEDHRAVSMMLRLLPQRHREVLARRYGLDQAGAQSHWQIGASLGIGAQRSRQIEYAALHRLRTIAAALES